MDAPQIRMLVISQNYPQHQIEWSGEFLVRMAHTLRPLGIDSAFLVPRAFAPWPLSRLPRWSRYGPRNPLLPCANWPAELVEFFRPPGAAFFKYEGITMRGPTLRTARLWHAKQPFDVVLGVQMNGEAVTAAWIGRSLGIPTAAMAIGTDVMVLPEKIAALRDIQAETLLNIDLPIAVSQALVDRLNATGACQRPPFLIRLPRDTTIFRPNENRNALRVKLGFSPDHVVGIYVGRLEAPKGMKELCYAARRCTSEHESFRLLCVGEGSYRDRLIASGHNENHATFPRVITPGRVQPDEVARFLQAADFLVLPSHSEGLPQVVLEAMNCGLPVIATDVGGTKEAVIDGETGLLIPARDPVALAAAMTSLITQPQSRERMGEMGMHHSHAQFDAIENMQQFAEVLHELVRKT